MTKGRPPLRERKPESPRVDHGTEVFVLTRADYETLLEAVEDLGSSDAPARRARPVR